jgi:hypothetical protein
VPARELPARSELRMQAQLALPEQRQRPHVLPQNRND